MRIFTFYDQFFLQKNSIKIHMNRTDTLKFLQRSLKILRFLRNSKETFD
jgi:hypothetical protein